MAKFQIAKISYFHQISTINIKTASYKFTFPNKTVIYHLQFIFSHFSTFDADMKPNNTPSCVDGSDLMKIRFNIKEMLTASDLQIKLVVEAGQREQFVHADSVSSAFLASHLPRLSTRYSFLFQSGNHPRRVNVYPSSKADSGYLFD